MTRRLNEVLAAAREIAQDNCIVDGDMRRDLEEWEAQLDYLYRNANLGVYGQLCEVRAHLGRGEPTGPRLTEATYRALVDALQWLYDAKPHHADPEAYQYCIENTERVLRAARAELGEDES